MFLDEGFVSFVECSVKKCEFGATFFKSQFQIENSKYEMNSVGVLIGKKSKGYLKGSKFVSNANAIDCVQRTLTEKIYLKGNEFQYNNLDIDSCWSNIEEEGEEEREDFMDKE